MEHGCVHRCFFPSRYGIVSTAFGLFYVLSLTKLTLNLKENTRLALFLPDCFYACYDILFYFLALTRSLIQRSLVKQLYFNELNLVEDYLIIVSTLPMWF
jgi:hypothetical protein